MLSRRRHEIRVLGYFVSELGVLTGAFFAGYALRWWTRASWSQSLEPLSAYVWLLGPMLAVSAVILPLTNSYQAFRTRGLLLHLASAVIAGALIAVGLFAAVALFREHRVNRSLIGTISGVSALSLFAWRVGAAGLLRHYTQKGYDRHYVIIGGAHTESLALARYLEGIPGSVFEVRGFVSDDPGDVGRTMDRWKVLGRTDEIPALAIRDPIDEVYLFPEAVDGEKSRALLEQCESMGVTVHFRLSMFDQLISRLTVEETGGRDFLTFSTAPRAEIPLSLKRLVDLLFAALLLVLLAPFLLAVAVLVRLTSRGPAVFRQERAGMNGRPFTLYKFRTMVQGSELRRMELEDRNELDGPAFKIKADPRVTLLGRFLRKTSIDELPQLWNVVKGDMSLVGPRPLPVYEVEKFERWQRRRMSMRPGITCLWQIRGRNRVTSFEEWMKMDLEYVDRWSLGLDLKILLLTIPAVLGGKGAY
jgi:exopolysaccharide biosynthesis polyprenyl glycosylphosphotransferase